MKNTLKRGLALFLAVALVAKSGVFSLDGSLKAATNMKWKKLLKLRLQRNRKR
jgi:hypothetical protein